MALLEVPFSFYDASTIVRGVPDMTESQWLESTVGKGEICSFRAISLFPSVFKSLLLQTHKNQGLLGKGLNHSHTVTPFDVSGKEAFSKHCGKMKTGNLHFLLFPQCFLFYQKQKLSFMLHLFCHLQIVLSIWTKLNFCRLEMC